MKFRSQLHEDYPSKEAIDKLSPSEIKEIYLKAPYGYFAVSSSLTAHFSQRVDETFTAADFKEFDVEYRKRLEEAVLYGTKALREKEMVYGQD